MPHDIRPVTQNDAADWDRLFIAYLAFYKTERAPEIRAQSFARILDHNEPMHSFLAFQDGQAVGMANILYHRNFWNVENNCYLNDLFVDPATRGGGFGAALINACTDHARENGSAKLYWTTAHDNDVARRLYDQIGNQTVFIKYDKDT